MHYQYKKNSNITVIFTDASKTKNNEIGIAYHIPSQQVEEQFKSTTNVSIFTAEAIAIHKAIQ